MFGRDVWVVYNVRGTGSHMWAASAQYIDGNSERA